MKASITLFFTLFFVLSLNVSLAQIELNPGEFEFDLSIIYVPRTEDGKFLHLIGNVSYLAIYWEAYYYGETTQRDIGVTCFLNCNKDISECSDAQNCSVITPPGKRGCAIINPNFEKLNSTYNVTCWFYDPNFLDLTKGSINDSFVPINFSFLISNQSAIVGEEVNIPLRVENSGLLTEKYNITFYSISPAIHIVSKNFSVELHGDYFEPHLWNKTGPDIRNFFIKLMVVDASAGGKSLCVKVTSNLDSSISKEQCVEIKAGFKSMSELKLLKILILMLIATIFIFKMKKIKKGL